MPAIGHGAARQRPVAPPPQNENRTPPLPALRLHHRPHRSMSSAPARRRARPCRWSTVVPRTTPLAPNAVVVPANAASANAPLPPSRSRTPVLAHGENRPGAVASRPMHRLASAIHSHAKRDRNTAHEKAQMAPSDREPAIGNFRIGLGNFRGLPKGHDMP